MRRATVASLSAVVVAAVAVGGSTPASAAGGAADPVHGEPAGDVVVDGEAVTTELPVEGVASTALDTLDVPVAELETGQVVESDGGREPDGRHDLFAAEPDAGLAALTEEQVTDEPFDLVGVTWGEESAEVERVLVRVRQDGEWSVWNELEVDDGGPDPTSPEDEGARPGTEPLIRPGSDGVQVRVETADGDLPDDLAVTLVAGGAESREIGIRPASATVTTATAARPTAVGDVMAAPTAAADGPAAALRPTIVTRAQWGADESIRGPIDQNSTVQAVVVHHTVNANDYSRAQAPAVVRSIYQYHVRSRGWSDVGYHFLVDRFGQVYEGRAGSIDRAPMGVHTGGFNTNTMGIAVIGDFRTTTPSAAAVDAVARVAAWKLGTYGRDPQGTTRLTARTGSTRQKPGWSGDVPVVLGHLDLGATACPGAQLYRLLPSIRSKAAAYLADASTSEVTSLTAGDGRSASVRYSTSGTTSWTATVTSVCATAPVRRLSGRATGGFTVDWDGRTDAGAAAPPGVYAMTVERGVRGRTFEETVWVEVLPPGGSGESTCGFSRWGGQNRYATAVALARAAYPSSSEVVVVAGAPESIVDGLVAAPFAAARKAPVLLAGTSTLMAETEAEVRRRRPTRAWLVGGDGVLSAQVERELRALGVRTVTRLAGDDRYATAEAVAARMPAARHAFVASGAPANLIDSAAVGGIAAAVGSPVLLSERMRLPQSTRSLLKDRGVTSTTVIGGTGALHGEVVGQLRVTTGGSVERLGGSDRYATALAVADRFATQVGTRRVTLAASADANLVDSVTGGVLGQVTLLVPGTAGHRDVDAWLARRGTSHVDLAGGPGVVLPASVASVVRAIR